MNSLYDQIADRAQHRCEYCRAPEQAFNFRFDVEHIIPKSRKGNDTAANLALSCRSCNLHKSNRTIAIDPETKYETNLFNLRQDSWTDHFQAIPNYEIIGKTVIGRATVVCLNMNHSSQIFARQLWVEWHLFP
jgi:5-methylcytosine-specific restriction endonuclease McrA